MFSPRGDGSPPRTRPVDEALYRLHAEREESYWWWVAKNRIILDLIRRYMPSRDGIGAPRALDIGCGSGGVLAKLVAPPLNFQAIGIDMSPIAREYCARRDLTALDGSLPDALPPSLAPGTFDVIIMSEVIEHVDQDRPAIETVIKLLRPGGVLVCTVPAHTWLWSSHDDFNFHKRRYTRSQFGALFEGLGFERIVLSYYQTAALPLVLAGRSWEKLRTRLTGVSPVAPRVRPLPGPANWLLTKAFEIEKYLLPRVRMPWGTSVISVHRKEK